MQAEISQENKKFESYYTEVGVERMHPFSNKNFSLDLLSCFSLQQRWVSCPVLLSPSSRPPQKRAQFLKMAKKIGYQGPRFQKGRAKQARRGKNDGSLLSLVDVRWVLRAVERLVCSPPRHEPPVSPTVSDINRTESDRYQTGSDRSARAAKT